MSSEHELPDFWTQEGDVSAVDPADLRSVWTMFRDVEARNPGQCTSVGASVYKSICSPGADVMAAWYRASMLWMMKRMMPEMLAQWTHDGDFDDVVFQIAAQFPMENMPVGVISNGPPFDVQEFVKQIGGRT
jgi:hypothetical protein